MPMRYIANHCSTVKIPKTVSIRIPSRLTINPNLTDQAFQIMRRDSGYISYFHYPSIPLLNLIRCVYHTNN